MATQVQRALAAAHKICYNLGRKEALAIEYFLSAGETVYIRVTGNEAHSMGTVYNFQVEKAS